MMVSSAKNAMVAAAHPMAAFYGLKALSDGANAMDACLVMAGVTSVTMPHMCGLGGDAFFIYYDAKDRCATALNGSGIAGDALDLEFARHAGVKGRILPQEGILSVAVPGAPLVYEMAARKFGSLSMEKLFAPAIAIAEDGFPVTPALARAIRLESGKLSKCPEARSVFLSNGNPSRPGTLMKRPRLAQTLRQFSEGGSTYLYKGPFAEKFYEMNEALGGGFTGRELADHCDRPPSFYSPLGLSYRGYAILQTAPVSQGFIVLEEMSILEHFDLSSMEPGSASWIHVMVEAKKIAFADRNVLAGDPAATGFDATRLYSKSYASTAASRIDLAQASGQSASLRETEEDTTSFVAWDAFGNACSFIHSNSFSFGSGLMVPGTGVILNNRAGRSFVLEPGHPNCLEPRKKPMHTLNCYMVLEDDVPFVVGGTPGGDGQPQWNMQMLSLLLDHKMSPQEAVDHPRWTSTPGTDVVSLQSPFELRMESRFPAISAKELACMGHTVKTTGEWDGGGAAQIIARDRASGVLIGGSDKRGEGLALGY